MIYRKPYSIYLRGTIWLSGVPLSKLCRLVGGSLPPEEPPFHLEPKGATTLTNYYMGLYGLLIGTKAP